MTLETLVTTSKVQNGKIGGEIVVKAIQKFNLSSHITDFFVLGLATGSSPVTTYDYIVETANSGEINIKELVCFNLDEYIGLPGKNAEERKNHKESYWKFMNENLYSRLKVKPHASFIPKGFNFSTEDIDNALKQSKEGVDYIKVGKENKGKAIFISQYTTCKDLIRIRKEMDDYSKLIESYGGIDLQVIGTGIEGHVGFHEAGIPFITNKEKNPIDAKFYTDVLLVELDSSTREKACFDRHFSSLEESPKYAFSMGNDLVFNAEKILLLANGEAKSRAILEGLKLPVSQDIPLSKIQEHEDATAVIDYSAANYLIRAPYNLKFI